MSDISDLVNPTGQSEVPEEGIDDLIAGPSTPEDTSGTRVENPGLESFGAGAVDASMIGPGMAAGIRLGQSGGAWGMAGGAIAGMAAGALAGPALRETIGLRTPDEMAPDQRPWGKSMYSFGGGATVALTPFGLARSAVMFLDVGIGKFMNSAIKQAAKNPVLVGTIEGTGVASSAAGAFTAETLAPGSSLAAFAGEAAGGVLNPVGRAIGTWNIGVKVFEGAMARYGRNAEEVKLGKQMVEGIRKLGNDPEAVIKVLESGNPYGLTAAQLTADPFFIATERALMRHSDDFSRAFMEKGVRTREAMTAQINMLMATGDPQFLGDIASLRKARFESLFEDRIKVATDQAKTAVGQGVRKGLTDANLPEVASKARRSLDAVDMAAKEHLEVLYDKVKLNIPVEMKKTQEVVDDILSRSAEELRGEKIPAFLRQALTNAEKNSGGGFSYDPATFVIGDAPAGPLMTDSRSMMDYRKKLMALARQADLDPSKAPEAGFAKRLQTAIMDDMDVAFKSAGDTSYDDARAFNRAYHDAFERSFAGEALALGKRGERIDPTELLTRAFATGSIAADIKLKDLEKATRLMSSRGLGDNDAVELMLDAQESAYRIIATASMKDGRINPDTMVEYIRKNGVLFNRPPFNEVRDDLLQAVKSETSLKRLEDLANRRNRDIGKKSAFAQITGSDPVAYASKILVSTSKQEDQLISMFNLAKKGGTNRQGITTVTSEQGISSARASVLNAAFNRSMTGSSFDLDKFRGLLFTPNVNGQKSVITIMREQGVMQPEHVQSLSKMFQVLENIKIAERQGHAIDVEKGVSEIGMVLGAKILASKATSFLQRASGQSGSSIIVHGAVAKAAEHVVSKIPAARSKDVAVLLFNDPAALAAVMRKETDPAKMMLQIRKFNAWAIQTGVTHAREALVPEYEDKPEMFAQ